MVGLQEEVRTARKEADDLQGELAKAKANALIPTAVTVGDSKTRFVNSVISSAE